VLLDLATGAVDPLGVADASEPAWDPRGGRLAVRISRGAVSTILLAPLDGSLAVDLTAGPGPDGAPAFAPQ
jgi:Tol biopolymer transport system component